MSRTRLRRTWVLACTLGEAAGIGAGAAATVLAPAAAQRAGVAGAVVLLVAAGVVEGGVLGGLQTRVLRRLVPLLCRWRWLTPLLVVGPLGWLAALPGALDTDTGAPATPWWYAALGGVAAGAVGGLLIGGLQAAALRRVAAGAGRWWVASVAGWAGLFGIVMTAAHATPAGWPVSAVAAAGALAGATGGGLLGVVADPTRLLRSVLPQVSGDRPAPRRARAAGAAPWSARGSRG